MVDHQIAANGYNYGSTVSALQRATQWQDASLVLHGARVTSISQHRCDDHPSSTQVDDAKTTVQGYVHILDSGEGVIAVSKPAGVSTEMQLNKLSAQIQRPITSVSRLDLMTSGSLVAAVGGP